MSGLLALLDDVAGIAKVAAASVDDIASTAAKTTGKIAGGVLDDAVKAGAKAAGAVIDDAAVTPKYTVGFAAERELPIVWRIARGSIRNKLLILLPAGLALNALFPAAIPPLLILGGAYLCFEGAEKVLHWIRPHSGHSEAKEAAPKDPARLEETRVAGAVKTDFILSAEIMTIALSEIPDGALWLEALTLAVVAIGITVLVYGAVALIVKADDVGLSMARHGAIAPVRAVGRAIVKGMPGFMNALMVVGTLAMLWVGGSIIVHSLAHMGWAGPEHLIHDIAVGVGHIAGEGVAFGEWLVTVILDGLLGLAIGAALIPVAEKVIAPAMGLFGGRDQGAGH